jgi:CubicO group peptidase (beta-lactamase class C family)
MRHVGFSPYLLAVSLAPVFLQTSTPVSCYSGDTTLSELAVIVDGVDQIQEFAPDVRSYSANVPTGTSEARVHTVSTDPEARVWVDVVIDEERLRYQHGGLGGGDVVVPLPEQFSTIEIWVRPPGGATDSYALNIVHRPEVQELEQFVDDFVWEHLLYGEDGPGLAIAVMGPNGVLFEKSYGMANVVGSVPYGPHSASNIGSVSKPFTATAVMLLYEDGLLQPEDSIADIFPEAPDTWRDITIHHLLTHTAGFYKDYQGDYGGPLAYPTNDDVLDWLVQVQSPLRFEPGVRMSYSNVGYMLLALAVERVSGQSFESFMEDRIFSRVPMENSLVPTNLPWPPEFENQAFGYRELLQLPIRRVNGSTGQYSSLQDLIQFELALRNNTVVSADTLELMYTPHVVAYDLPELTDAIMPGCYYGYGWYVCDRPTEPPNIWHSGRQDGFFTSFGRFPDAGLTVLMVSNGTYEWVWDLIPALDALYLSSEPVCTPNNPCAE